MKRLLLTLGTMCLGGLFIWVLLIVPVNVGFIIAGSLLAISLFTFLYFGLFKDI